MANQRVKVSSYIKNLGRSFGYAMSDNFADYSPVAKDIITSTRDTYKEIKDSMRDIKNNNVSGDTKKFLDIKTIFKNSLDDLKTGNWYNKKREEEAMDDIFGFGDLDFDEDWGDSFDDIDIDSDTSDDIDESVTSAKIIKSMDNMKADLSKSIGYTSARSAEYIVQNNNIASKAMYDLTGKGFNQVTSVLLNMSDTMAGISKLGEPITAHISNSATFYTRTSEALDKINSNLDILVKRTSYLDDIEKRNNKDYKNKKSFGNIFSNGEFNMSAYTDMVKENLGELKETIDGFKDIISLVAGSGGKGISLTKTGIKAAANKIVPKITKDITAQFGEALSASLGNALMRGSYKGSSNILVSMLSDLFFPSNSMKTSIDPSKYEKGPMPWDGISRHSLTYVIPTYLAQITSMIAGISDEDDYRYYDFKTGKFTSKRIKRKEIEAAYRSEARYAGGNFREQAINATSSMKIRNELDEFFYQSLLKGEDFYNIRKGKNDPAWRKKYGNISPEALDVLIRILDENNKSGPNKNRNNASKWESEVYSRRAEIDNRMRRLEAEGLAFELGFYDNSSSISQGFTGLGSNRRRKSRNAREKQVINANRTTTAKYTRNYDDTYTLENGVVLSAKKLNEWLEADSDTKEKIEKDARISNGVRGIKDKIDSFDNLFGKKVEEKTPNKFKSVFDKTKSIVQMPFYAVTMALDSLNRGINTLFWGDSSNTGILDKLKEKLTESWNTITEKLSNLSKDAKRDRVRREQGLPEGTADIIPDERYPGNYLCLNDKGSMIGTCDAQAANAWYKANRKVAGWKESIQNEWENIKNAAKDKIKTTMDKTRALKDEYYKFKNSNGFDDDFGLGSGIAGGASGVNNSNFKRISNSNYFRDKSGKYYRYDPVSDIYIPATKEDTKGISDAYRSAIATSSPVGLASEGMSTLFNGVGKFVSQVLSGNKDNPEKEKQNFFKNIQKALADAGDEKGAIAIGAIGGVGVSLLTGAIVGPLAAAAIGAGVGLASKSKAFQDFLFGEGDPDDPESYKKGLLGDLGKWLKNDKNRDIAKTSGIYGGVGLVGGTLVGSPILGMITGSTIGYVSRSKKAQEFLFGKDNDTALGELKENIKKNAPHVAAGAIAGLVAGPFGIVGNLLLGGTLGYVSTTEKFHNYMFGDPNDPKDKGLAGKLHDSIINPINEIMHNLKNRTFGFTRKLAANINRIAKSLFARGREAVDKAAEGKGILARPARLLRGVGRLGARMINLPINIAGGILDYTDTRLKKSNLSTGSSVYSGELGRNETAAERLETRKILKNGGVVQEEGPNGEPLYYKVNANGKRKLISEDKYVKIMLKNYNGKGWRENRKYGRIDQAIADMSDEEIQALLGKNGKEFGRVQLAKILDTDVNKVKESDLAQFMSLARDEKARFTPEKEAAKDKEKDNKFKDTVAEKAAAMSSSLDSLVVNVASILHKIDPNASIDTGSDSKTMSGLDKLKSIFGTKGKDKTNEENNTDEVISAEGSRLRKIFGAGSNTRTEFTSNGPIQYVTNRQGEWIVDKSDTETKNTIRKQDEFNSSISTIAKMGGVLGGLAGLFRTKDEGGEKKEGLLSKLFKGLLGENGALAGLLGLFTGKTGTVASIVKTIFSKGSSSILKTLLKDVGIGALIYSAFSGKLDSITSRVTGILGGKGAEDAYSDVSIEEGRTYSITDSDGNSRVVRKDSDGNYIDTSTNEVVDTADIKSFNASYQNNTASLSDKMKENFVRGLVTGKRSVTTALFNKTTAGKAISKASKSAVAVTRAATSASGLEASATLLAYNQDISSGIVKFCSKLKKLPMLKNIDMDGLASELSMKITNKLASESAQSVLKFASKAVVWINAALIVVDFTTGYQDARVTLGIIDKPTVAQRIVSGLVRAIKNFIPVVGTLIPDSLVIDVFCNYVAPAFGIDTSELMKQREDAQDEVDKYNQEHGTDYTVNEYVKEVMHDYTWVEKAKNAWSTIVASKDRYSVTKKAYEEMKAATSNGTADEKTSKNVKKANTNFGGNDAKADFSKIDARKTFGGASGVLENNNAYSILGKVKNRLVSDGIISSSSDLSAIYSTIPTGASISTIGNNISRGIKTIYDDNSRQEEAIVNTIVNKTKQVVYGTTEASVDNNANMIEKVKNRLVSAGIISEDTDLTTVLSTSSGKFTKLSPASIFSKIISKVKVSAKKKASSASSMISGVVSKVKSSVSGSGSNNTNNSLSGGDSGFVSQFDPRYQNYKVSGEQFGIKGCGPAVASMAASAMGKNLSVGDAVRASSNYQTSGGVTLDYFQNALGSRGINTELISGGSSADMYSRIARGQKMILLGQDPTNTSKEYSPFGPNNHYVLATGTDARGNIIVNDPEARTPKVYSPSILNHTKYGIAGSNSGLSYGKVTRYIAGGDSSNTAAQVWYFLRNNGFTEQAAAGILGNLRQETNFDYTLKNSVTQGIACWDKTSDGEWPLEQAAAEAGKDWKDLAFQLSYLLEGLPYAFDTYTGRSPHYYSTGEWCWWPTKMSFDQFKVLTSVNDAAEIFERVYERASIPRIEKRILYANAYYEQFTGKQGEVINYTDDSGKTQVVANNTKTVDNSILNLANNVTSAFASGFDKIIGKGGNKEDEEDSTTSNSNAPKATFSSSSPTDYMKNIAGTISYSMGGARDPDKGSADCSSTVNWAIRKAGGPDIGSNTESQLDNKNLFTIWDGKGKYANKSDLLMMKKDDVIFFSRPNDSYTAGRKYRVGHVGLYLGDGKYIDHGGPGKGPNENTLSYGANGKIVKVGRVNTSASGSGIYSYNDMIREAAGSSGLLLASRAGANSGIRSIRDPRTGRLVPITKFSGGASGDIALDTTQLLNEASRSIRTAGNNGTISNDIVVKLLDAITKLLANIANNTAPVDKIYNALTTYLSGGASGTKDTNTKDTNVKKNTSKNKVKSLEVDSSVVSLVGVLAELAKG